MILSPICPSCKTVNEPRYKAMTVAMTCRTCNHYFGLGAWNNDTIKFNFKDNPAIAIGRRGKIDGVIYEVANFAVREERRYHYKWREYGLFNPTYGLAYLTEYNGQWNFLKPAEPPGKANFVREFDADDKTFRLYQKMRSRMVFGKGEFFADYTLITDEGNSQEFISPPYIYTLEEDKDYKRWFKGEYISVDRIGAAFPDDKHLLPTKEGRGYTQPFAGAFSKESLVLVCFLLAAVVIGLQILFATLADERVVFQKHFDATDLKEGEKMFVTEPFKLEARSAIVEVNLWSSLNNDWFYGDFTLVNDDDHTEYDFSKEIDYYFGSDSDGSWSEGSRAGEALLSQIPSGNYHINIYPQFGIAKAFDISVVGNVSSAANMWYTLALLSLFPIVYFIWRYRVEVARWSDSDFSPYDSNE